MSSEGLEDLFSSDFADTCVNKFHWGGWRDKQPHQAFADREQGPPLAPADFMQRESK